MTHKNHCSCERSCRLSQSDPKYLNYPCGNTGCSLRTPYLTVGHLLEKLKQMPPDAEIRLEIFDDHGKRTRHDAGWAYLDVMKLRRVCVIAERRP